MTVINTANKLYVGTSLASKAYAGANQVWPPAATGIPNKVLHYPMDDLTTTDTSGFNNTGIMSGTGTTLVTGHTGTGALSFNGSGYVMFTDVSKLELTTATSEMTVCCWIKTSATDAVVLSLRNHFTGNPVIDFVIGNNAVANTGTGKPAILLRDNDGNGLTSVISTTAVNNNAWRHIAFTRSSAKLTTFYIDSTASGTGTDGLANSAQPSQPYAMIGKEILNGAMPMFVGLMDDFRVYSRALTGAEISSIYAGTG
jgi:hypothetical protein